MFAIRKEIPDDAAAIREVNRQAFGGEAEANLVDRLRSEGLVIVSLVAEKGGRIVGHILFSELPIETSEGVIRGAALAPMAVVPGRQRQGIGSALVEAGLKGCGEAGVAAVVVVGYPEYYPRFGFSAERAACLRSPYPGDAFMVLDLRPGARERIVGTAKYPAAFAEL
jgi:putative acetyltransferase